MEPHNYIVIYLIVFFNPFLISPSTGYYVLKRVVEDPPEDQVHHQSRKINPRFNSQPRARRGSSGGGSEIAPVSLGSTDEIIYTDEIFDESAEPPESEYIDVNQAAEEEPLEKHILFKRNTRSQSYSFENCPASNYHPITCKGPGNFPINNTECILYHHCPYGIGKYFSQKRCCYIDRRFDHVLRVCKPLNEARCPVPVDSGENDNSRMNREATVQTSGTFTSAEFGEAAGVGNQFEKIFETHNFADKIIKNAANGNKGNSGNQNNKAVGGHHKYDGGHHGGDQTGNFFDIHNVGAGLTHTSSQNTGTGGSGHAGDQVASIFHGLNFPSLQNQNKGNQIPSGGQNAKAGGQNAKAGEGGHVGDQLESGQNFPVVGNKNRGNQSPSGGQNSDAGVGGHVGDQNESVFSGPNFPTVGNQNRGNQSPSGGQNSDAGEIVHVGDQIASMFPFQGAGAGQKSANKNQNTSASGVHGADKIATSFDMLHFGGGGSKPGGSQLASHIDHSDRHEHSPADKLSDRFGRHHKHHEAPIPGNQSNNNFYGNDGGGFTVENLMALLANLQRNIPGPFWFHNTKSGNMRPATYSPTVPVIIPIIINMPPQQQMDMDEQNNGGYINQGGPNLSYENNGNFYRSQNNNYNPTSLKGGFSNDKNRSSKMKSENRTYTYSKLQTYQNNNGKGNERPETLDLSSESNEAATKAKKINAMGRSMGGVSDDHDDEPKKNCTKGRPRRKSRKGRKRSNHLEGQLQANVSMEDFGNETSEDDGISEEDVENQDEGLNLTETNLENSTTTGRTIPISITTSTTAVPTTVAMVTLSSSMVSPPKREIDSTTMSSLILSSTGGFVSEDGTDWASDFDDSVEVDDLGNLNPNPAPSPSPSPSTPKSIVAETVVLTGITNRHGQLIKIKPVRRRDKSKSN